jgi:nucleoside-diphosphate-sugar epimerase
MRILVTGADGFIGSRLVKELSRDHSVVALCLEKEEVRGAQEVVNEDLASDLSKLSKKRFDAVFHLAAVLDETDPSVWEINVEGTRNLLELCKRRKIERFVFLGPIGVLGETKEPAREDFPYNPQTHYEKSKAEAERVIMDYKLRYQIPYTIVRSTIVYGPNRFWSQILKAAKKGYPLIGKGDNYFHLVYIDDIVRALAVTLDVKAKNQIFHVAGPDPKTYKETYEIITKLLGVPKPETNIPVPVAKARALAHEVSSKVQGKRPDVTLLRASIDRLVRNRIVSTEKIERELGFKPYYTLEKGMEKTVKTLGF